MDDDDDDEGAALLSAPSVRRINIAVASPTDVKEERAAVLRVLNRWNTRHHHAVLNAIGWESASVPTLGDHPQNILNEQIIRQSQLLVAILWSKLGTKTPTAPSGTVDEINEFIRLKGPRRVMLYFCRRAVPHELIDPAELARLYAFKDEMQSRGLYAEYQSVEEFERTLYEHLDSKVADLLAGRLPSPGDAAAVGSAREPDEFGTTLDTIAVTFASRMAEFGDHGAGPNKYLALGAKLYDGVAASLDRFLAYTSGIRPEDRAVAQSISARLKRLAASYADYVKRPFPAFWDEGRALSRELSDHVAHLGRMRRR